MKYAFALLAFFVALLSPARADPQYLKAGAKAFQDRVDMAARMMNDSPRLKDLTQQQRREIVQFVSGNMLFALLHEMGHVHVTEMGLPVLGREEDAADSFAVVTMLKVGSAFSHEVLVQAAMGWFLSADRDAQQKTPMPFYDEHGLDKQRAYQIVCLMVGSDPDKFKDLADKVGLPDERQGSCQGDYSNASWSWETAMRPFLRAFDQPKTKIDVIYEKGETEELAAFEKSFREIQLLETVADQASNQWIWRRPFALEMQSCGSPNARWDLATRKLILCYEMGAEFAQLYRQYGTRIALPHYYK